MRYININVLSEIDTADATGILIDAKQLISASFIAYFGDSSVNGTITVQSSNDPSPEGYMSLAAEFTPTNWIDIPNATATVASGASVIIPKMDLCYRWIRVIFTFTSGGSTTVNVNMMALSM